MSLVDRLASVIESSPTRTQDPEFDRLRDFLKKMREAGIAKVSEYDLPLPDTLGSARQMRLGSPNLNDSPPQLRKLSLFDIEATSAFQKNLSRAKIGKPNEVLFNPSVTDGD